MGRIVSTSLFKQCNMRISRFLFLGIDYYFFLLLLEKILFLE